MNRHYPNAAAGMRLLFTSQILMIVGALLAWVPLVGSLVVIAAAVLEILGIYKAGADDENYRGTLLFAAAILVVGVVSSFVKADFLLSLLNVVSDILNLLMVYSICNTTANLLHSLGNEVLSERGATVIKIYSVCTVVSIVCQVLGVIPIVNIVAGLVAIVAAIVQVVGYVMYLVFLDGSSKAL